MTDTVEARMALLGRHVAFMGEMAHKAVTDKYLANLARDHDIKKYCLKMARVLEGVIKNSVCYAKDLHNLVVESGHTKDLAEVTKLLETIVVLDESLISNKTENETEYKPEIQLSPKKEIEHPESQSDSDADDMQQKKLQRSKKFKKKKKLSNESSGEPKSEKLSYSLHEIAQDSLHIGPENCKTEMKSEDEVSEESGDSRVIVAASKKPHRSISVNELVPNPLNETFQSKSTVRAPSRDAKSNMTPLSASDESDSNLDKPLSTPEKIKKSKKLNVEEESKQAKENESECKKGGDKRSDEKLEEPVIADSQSTVIAATILDTQDLADVFDKPVIEDVKSGQRSRRNSAESFVFDMANYNDADQGAKNDRGSEHISEFDTPTPADHGSENIEDDDQSEKKTLIDENQSKDTDFDASIPKNTKATKEKVIRKSLLKLIDEYFKKKKTQRKKRTPNSRVNKKITDTDVNQNIDAADKELENCIKTGKSFVENNDKVENRSPIEKELVVNINRLQTDQQNDQPKLLNQEIDSQVSNTDSEICEKHSETEKAYDTLAKDIKPSKNESVSTSEIKKSSKEIKTSENESESDSESISDSEKSSPIDMEHSYQKKMYTKQAKIDKNIEKVKQEKNWTEEISDSSKIGDHTYERSSEDASTETDSEIETKSPKSIITSTTSVVEILSSTDCEKGNSSEVDSLQEQSEVQTSEKQNDKKIGLKDADKDMDVSENENDIQKNGVKEADKDINILEDQVVVTESSDADVEDGSNALNKMSLSRTEPRDIAFETLNDVQNSDLNHSDSCSTATSCLEEPDKDMDVLENQVVVIESSDAGVGDGTNRLNEMPVLQIEPCDVASEIVVPCAKESEETEEESFENFVKSLKILIEQSEENSKEKRDQNESAVDSDSTPKSQNIYNICGGSDLESYGEEEQKKKESENDADSESSCVGHVKKKLIRLTSTEEDSTSSTVTRKEPQCVAEELSEEESANIDDTTSDASTNKQLNGNDGLDLLRKDVDKSKRDCLANPTQSPENDNQNLEENQENSESSSSRTLEYSSSLKDVQEDSDPKNIVEDSEVPEGNTKDSMTDVEDDNKDVQDTEMSEYYVAVSETKPENDETSSKNSKVTESLENKNKTDKDDPMSDSDSLERPKDGVDNIVKQKDDEIIVGDDIERQKVGNNPRRLEGDEMNTDDDKISVGEDKNDSETETDNNDFKLDDQERDELLELLDEHFKTINKEERVKTNETKETDEIVSRAASGGEINRDLLMQLLQEYEDAVAAGKDLDLEEEQLESEEVVAESGNDDKAVQDADKEGTADMERDGSRTPEPLFDVVKEEEFVLHTPGKKGRKKTEMRQATEIYRKLMEDDSDLDSSSISVTSSPTKSIGSDLSDTENGTKKSRFKVSKKLLEQYGIDKELVVNLEKSDIGDSDISKLPKSAKEAVNIDRLCDLTSILQKRTRNSSTSDPDTPRKRRGKKRRDSSSTSLSTPTSPALSSDDDESYSSSRPHSRNGGHSPDFHSDDSQEAMARAFLDRMNGDSSDDNSPLGGEDTASDLEEKKKKKRKSLLEDEEGDEKKSKEEGEGEEGNEEGPKEGSGDEERKKTPKELSAAEKRKKRWKRDPLLHERMLSSGTSSSDNDSDASAGSDASERRRKRMNILKSKYDVKSTDSDSKKLDSDDKINSDSDSDPMMKRLLTKKSQAKRPDSDSDSSSVEFVSAKMKTPPRPKRKKDSSESETDDDVEAESPSKGKGRRNIRELLADEALAVDTKKANEEEKKRIKRLEEKKSQRETFSQTQSFGSQDGENDALVLDIDKKTLEPLVKVHPKITRRLKPHQRDGIQFMWDSCYESCDQMKKGWKGSGCILAHCMGLGKTLQVLGLVQAIFKHNDVTKTKHVLVVCPLSTVSNWRNEYKLAYKNIDNLDLNIFTIEDRKTSELKFEIVKRWRKRGGILVMGYEAFGNLTNENKLDKWQKQRLCSKEAVLEALVDPGPDLVVCDEGHLLKNKQTNRNISLNKVKTRRRIVLTGTPLQNNLIEYYCMVNFVKPNLLGNEKEYKINFVSPITNGQYEDSNYQDIKLMKYRTHVLHKILKGTVQRVEDTELKKYLPNLVDYALFLQVSDMQVKFYNTYLDLAAEGLELNKEGNLCQKNFLADVVMVKYICSHPYLLSVVDKKKKVKEQDVIDDPDDDQVPSTVTTNKWWRNMMPDDASERLELGHKIMLALAIVEEAEALNDKVLIFSQNLGEMDVLEHFLSTKGTKACPRWQKRIDYYRMDGTIIPEERAIMCDKFNNPKNKKLRVFIMSTKVGGLGLNLTAANRIVIMNVMWNPSYDTQSVFRAYRFGQEKPVFVYRLISMSTMEEKIYQRSVTKLAVAHRVVDKHQVKRAYSRADIEEMYGIRPTANTDRPVPKYPEDDELLAKLLQKHKFIHRWHEHQGLLANRPEEDLDDQEKEAAWEEFNRKQEAPPPAVFGPGGMMPNMGSLAMNMGYNPADLINMINNFMPKYADEHSYSLPTNINAPSTSGLQPNNQPAPNNVQPRVLFNQPPNHQSPATLTAPNSNNKNLPNKINWTNNIMVNGIRPLTQPNNQVNGGRPLPQSNNHVPVPTSIPNTVTSGYNAGYKRPNNWLLNQLPSVGPDQPLRFALKSNMANEHGLLGITWPGVKIQSKGGLIHYAYIPPHLPSNMYMTWTSHQVVAPDGSTVMVYTQKDPPKPIQQQPAAKTAPGSSGAFSTTTTDQILRQVGTTVSSKAGQIAVTSTVPSSKVPPPQSGTALLPKNSGGPGYTKVLAKGLTSPTNNAIKGLRLVPTSTLTGRQTPPATNLGNHPVKVVTSSSKGGGPSTETKQVVPNPFSREGPLSKTKSMPLIRRLAGLKSATNNVKAAGLTGTDQVLSTPAGSQVRLPGSVTVKRTVAPPPAHAGKAVASPTVAKHPRLAAQRRSIENLSPRNPVDLSAPSNSKTTANSTPSPKRSQNLLKSPPNQNFNSNLKTAINNSIRNSPRATNSTITNSPTSNRLTNSAANRLMNSPKSSRNQSQLSNSPKPSTSTGAKYVTSRDISNGASPGGGKRVYDTLKTAEGGANKSPVPAKKIIISQNNHPNHSVPTALPALTPRPTVAPINFSTQDIYKEMLKNIPSFASKAPATSKLQTIPSRAAPPTTPSTSPPTSNKENRRNRLQLNRRSSDAVDPETLEKLIEKGVSVNKVEKADSGIIHLD